MKIGWQSGSSRMTVGSNTFLIVTLWTNSGPALMRTLTLFPPYSRPPMNPTFLSKKRRLGNISSPIFVSNTKKQSSPITSRKQAYLGWAAFAHDQTPFSWCFPPGAQPPVQTHLLVSILITTGTIHCSYLKYKKFTSGGSNTGRATGLPEDSEAAKTPEF